MFIEIRNPAAPEQIVATFDETPLGALDDCVARAGLAQAGWAAIPQPERGALVANFVDALEARTEDIAMSITKEMGKPLAEAHMLAYVRSPKHMKAMRAFPSIAIGRLLSYESDTVPSWDEALLKWEREARNG